MDGYIGLPVTIWGDVICPFIGIHDCLSLKLLNKYSLRHFPSLLARYTSLCTHTKTVHMNFPLLTQVQTEYSRLISEAYDYLSVNIDPRCLVEMKANMKPVDCVAVAIKVWMMLLTGSTPTDPIQAFHNCSDCLTPLRTLNKVQNRDAIRNFLEKYTETRLQNASSTGRVFYKYLEMLNKGEELKTVEFEEAEKSAIYWEREEAVCLKAAQTR